MTTLRRIVLAALALNVAVLIAADPNHAHRPPLLVPVSLDAEFAAGYAITFVPQA